MKSKQSHLKEQTLEHNDLSAPEDDRLDHCFLEITVCEDKEECSLF